jgi:two-component system response regulator EvgA
MTPANQSAYHILALDDHPVVLEGLSHLLSAYDVTTCAQAGQLSALLKQGLRPDLFILDLELPDADGFELISNIRRHCPEAAILIYTMHEEPWVLARLANLDLQGVVGKAQPVADLPRAVETIRQGGTAFSPVMETLPSICQTAATMPPLSEREQQVLSCIARGMTTPQMADSLFLSENIIDTYRRRLMKKFGAHNAAQLVSKARHLLK